MKLSKSILNPIRATRNGAAVSLSFLRRTNKGGAQHSSSPFFTTTASRKRVGGASENPEPSSPKVTCIGQVRVKSKKKSKQQCRSLSRRRTGGEISFRKTEQNSLRRRNNNQRWVHLPISACEALRLFGAEFSSCLLFPCCRNSSCVGENIKSGGDDPIEGGCCRWLVCAGDGGRGDEIEVVIGGGDGGRGDEIEVVIGGGDEEEEEMMCGGSLRRHVLEDFEVKNGRIEVKGRSLEVDEGVSICVPPKNALLLMRCRSDPMKMAALVNRCSWEFQNQDIEEEEYENAELEETLVICDNKYENIHFVKAEAKINEELVNDGEENEQEIDVEEESESNMSSFEALLDQESGEDNVKAEKSPQPEKEEEAADKNDVASPSEEEEEEETEEAFQKNQETLLPDCLLLMMCEPKLSMEVSKETWVRSTDFIRWLPDRPRMAAAGCEHHQVVKRRPSVDSKPRPPGIPVPPVRKNDHRLQPPRSSCSLPAATMVERKLQGGAYEPFALTRCKSEPMRTAAAKLLPESCLWKNGCVQLEPHGRAALGVGAAAGVGF